MDMRRYRDRRVSHRVLEQAEIGASVARVRRRCAEVRARASSVGQFSRWRRAIAWSASMLRRVSRSDLAITESGSGGVAASAFQLASTMMASCSDVPGQGCRPSGVDRARPSTWRSSKGRVSSPMSGWRNVLIPGTVFLDVMCAPTDSELLAAGGEVPDEFRSTLGRRGRDPPRCAAVRRCCWPSAPSWARTPASGARRGNMKRATLGGWTGSSNIGA